MTALPAPEKIRLLQLTTVFAIGGTERQLVNLANGLDASRFDVRLACLRRWGALLGELEQTLPPAEFPITSFYRPDTLLQQLRFAALLRRQRIQLFHAHGFYPNVFGALPARLAGTPVVITSVRDQGDSRTPLQEKALRLACTISHGIVVNAEVIRAQLIGQGYPEAKIHVIRNGVDLSRFASGRGQTDLRRELGLAADAEILAVVSRLNRSKGIDDFLCAAALVAGRHPRARFLVVGDTYGATPGSATGIGSYRVELERLAQRLGLGERVIFTGFRMDVPELLSQVSLCVHPSHSEALSNSLIESMAAGAPVVATRVGGNPEVVEDGVSGLTVPARSPEALARAIDLLLDQPQLAARFAEAGRRRVREQFSVERMVRDTERLYLALLERSAHRRLHWPRLSHGPAPSSQSSAP
jgi:glycosyltransferase involved in cell wall biosynthesis